MANKEVTHKLEQCLFGRDPEMNLGSFPIRYTAALLFVDVKQTELVRFNGAQYFSRVVRARECIRSTFVAGKIEGTEADRLQGALLELPTVPSQLAVGIVGETIRESVLDAADRKAIRQFAEQNAYRVELTKAIAEVDPLIGSRLNDALLKLGDALQENGLERNTQLREAKGLLTEAGSSGGMNHPSTWFASAVATWALTESPSETMAILKHAIGAPRPQPVSLHFANRLMAYLCMLDGESERCRSQISSALNTFFSPDALVEGYLYAAQTGDQARCSEYSQALLEVQPAELLNLLSEDVSDSISIGLIQTTLRQQLVDRQDAKTNLEIWSNAVKSVEEIEAILGTELEIPVDLHHGHKMVAPSLESADAISAGHLKRWTQESGTALLMTMRTALQQEEMHRAQVAANMTLRVEQLFENRENTKKELANSNEQAEYRARTALAAVDKDGEKAQKGCAVGGGAGCAIFVGYMVLSLILGFRGIEIGLSSPIGMAAIGTSALPIVLAILLQIIAGVKRMMKEGEIQAEVHKFSEQYQLALKQADEAYEQNIGALKEKQELAKSRLAECQALMKKLPGQKTAKPASAA